MKKIIISIILVISIIALFVLFNVINNKTTDTNISNNNEIFYNQVLKDNSENISNDDLYEIRKAITDFANSRNIVLAKVNGKEITEKRLCITKYYYQDSEDLLAQEIENIVLTQLALSNNLEISTKELEWQNKVMEGLRKDILNSDIEYDTDEFLELLREGSYNLVLKYEYIRFLTDRMKNGTLEIKDDNLREEYEIFLKKYNKWQEDKNILQYPEINNLKETLIQKYIDYQVSMADVKKYIEY